MLLEKAEHKSEKKKVKVTEKNELTISGVQKLNGKSLLPQLWQVVIPMRSIVRVILAREKM